MAEVKVYLTPYCGYCVAAVDLLTRKGVPFESIDVSRDDAKRAWLREVTGRTSVPQIFIDGRPYGGFTDIAALDRRGDLDRLLAGEALPSSAAE